MKNKNKLDDYEQRELDMALESMENPYAFEKVCGSCDHFDTEDCPYRDKVLTDTLWGIENNCTNYIN